MKVLNVFDLGVGGPLSLATKPFGRARLGVELSGFALAPIWNDMARNLKIYLSMLVVFFAIDILWIAGFANSFYYDNLGFMLRSTPVWPVAILFYLIYLVGLLVFAVRPSLDHSQAWEVALAKSAFFGFVTYATYDLTNHATVKDWPWIVTVVDMAWGTFLCGVVGTAGYFVGKRVVN